MKKQLIILFISLIPVIGFGQKAKSTATIDKDTIFIGDQMKMRLEILTNGKTKVSWPEFKESIVKGIEILDKTAIDTVSNKDGSLSYIQDFTLTSFDTGFYEIKGLNFSCMDQVDTLFYKTISNPLFIRVNTVEVDTTQAFKPIKGPISQGYTFGEFIPYIGGFILLVVAIILIYYFFFRKKKEGPILARSRPKIPAHILALNQLDSLKDKELWQESKFKEYYTELTDIFRNYIEAQYNIDALEMTSDEIRDAIKPFKEIEEQLKSKVSNTLSIADLVKFAKMQPMPEDNINSLTIITEFVKDTSRKKAQAEVAEEEKQKAEQSESDKLHEDKNGLE